MTTTTAVNNPVDAGTNEADGNGLDNWKEQAREKLLNFSTSNKDVLDFILEAAEDKESSPQKMQAINYLLNLRTEMGTMMTNALRAIFDASSAIIRNIRA